MKHVTLVTGGSRSGKSSHALTLTEPYKTKAFIATAEAFDDEMKDRIIRHQEERDKSFFTIEEPIDVANAIRSVPEKTEIILLDCLTVWLGNLMFRLNDTTRMTTLIQDFLAVLENPPCEIIVVTNEIGMGIVPGDAESRLYRDLAGRLNQDAAKRADRVVLVVSGIPVIIKGK